MIKQKELVPKRRFEEYRDSWEFFQLKEVLFINSGRDYKHLNKGNIPVYGTGGLMLFVDDKLSEIDGIGIGRKGTIDNPQYLKAPFWTVDTLFFMTPSQKINLNFMYSKSQIIDWRKMDESTGVPSLSKVNIEKIPLYLPKYKEQQKIGQFFKHLDEMIALEQRKIDKTKALKSAYLAEMFPAKGECVPKRRFEGFTDEWKKMIFGDLVTIKRGLTYKPTDLSKTGVRVLRSSNINEDKFELRSDDVFVKNTAIDIEEARENDILITSANGSSRLIGKHALVKGINTRNVHGGFMLLGRTQEPYFINTLMSASWYKEFIKIYVSGGNGSIGNIRKGDLEKQEVYVPSQLERKKIGGFFKNLDNIIATHEQKLEKLKATKQAYLHEMFV